MDNAKGILSLIFHFNKYETNIVIKYYTGCGGSITSRSQIKYHDHSLIKYIYSGTIFTPMIDAAYIFDVTKIQAADCNGAGI